MSSLDLTAYMSYEIKSSLCKKVANTQISKEIKTDINDQFYGMMINDDFPTFEEAKHRRNYFYKNFKNYYKRYLAYIEESLKPQKIEAATKENPYHLFGDFYTYDNKVFEFASFTNQIIELPKADPLTFGNRGYLADKNYVYARGLAKDSPPKDIFNKDIFSFQNNPKAKWEWYFLEGIDGSTFTYVKEKWDTVYNKDKNHIIYNGEIMYEADYKSFDYIGVEYGIDKNHVYCRNKIISIDPKKYKLKKRFIHDDTNIYSYKTKLYLDAKTFQIIANAVYSFIGRKSRNI